MRISVDTGGTSFDVSLVRKARIPWTRETWLGEPFHGHVTGFPSIDVKSIGAGGGSVARVDSGGMLRVGPDEVMISITQPGGGYGPPAEREPERVAKDVAEGWISAARARQVYKVAIDGLGRIESSVYAPGGVGRKGTAEMVLTSSSRAQRCPE